MTLSKSDSNSAALLRLTALLDGCVLLRVAALFDESALPVITGFVLVLALQFTSVPGVPGGLG